MKRVIITGATGAVGTALINEMIAHDVEVLVLCREGSKRNDHIPMHPLVSKRYCSLNQLAELTNVNNVSYDVFYHLAWDGTTGSARNDMFLQNQNVKYALDAVDAAKRLGCKKFIGIGSQAEYGRVEGMLTPMTSTFPESGYGIAKLCAGQMTREHAHKIGMEHVWVRILSVYGPNDGPQSLVMSLVDKMKQGIVPECTKGEQLWDYLYSGDAARALFLLGQKGVDGKVYVLGSGQARPLKQYIEEIREIVNPQCEVAYGAVPYGDRQVMHLQADICELTDDTGWKPQTVFQHGIESLL